MDADWLRDLIERVGYEVREYSGRGMYGKQCIGLVYQDETQLQVLANLVDGLDEISDASSLLRKARIDNMGRGFILYWPSAKIADAA